MNYAGNSSLHIVSTVSLDNSDLPKSSTNATTHSLIFCNWNVRSIMNKTLTVIQYLEDNDVDIAFISLDGPFKSFIPNNKQNQKFLR